MESETALVNRVCYARCMGVPDCGGIAEDVSAPGFLQDVLGALFTSGLGMVLLGCWSASLLPVWQ